MMDAVAEIGHDMTSTDTASTLKMGTRLRNRRLDQGLRQAHIAEAVGISPAYLNLIEHNRRRISGRLLRDLADVLSVDADALTDGESAAKIRGLAQLAEDVPEAGAEVDRADELMARFPGWFAVLEAQGARLSALEEDIASLRDRLNHDLDLAAALHEVISTATAIRSTTSILVDAPDLDGDWRLRFHKNLDVESARLAQSSQTVLKLLQKEAEREGEASRRDL